MTLAQGPPQRNDSDVLTGLVRAFARFVDECRRVSAVAGADDFDLARSPAGKRRAYRAARAGDIDGAVKRQRRWYSTRAAHDSWLESISHRPGKVEVETPSEAPTRVDGLRARLSLVRVR